MRFSPLPAKGAFWRREVAAIVRSRAGRTPVEVTLVRLIVVLFVGLFALGSAVAAPSPDDNCLMCHGDPAAKNDQGKPIAVDPKSFKASVHGEMRLACVMCHVDVADGKLPHAQQLKPVDCAGCHDKAAAAYAGTVHGKARKDGRMLAATCGDCHGHHDIRRSADTASRTHHNNIEKTCASCHGSDEYVAKAKLPGGNIDRKYHDSIHGKLLAGSSEKKDVAPDCTACHGSHAILAKDDPQSRTHRARVPETCGGCHFEIRKEYMAGQHGKLRQQGMTAAPGCNDCHSAHDIQQHDVARFQLGVIDECGKCHQDFIGTYRDTFHGKVTELGFVRVATCASCHGGHEVLPASDPKSRVSAQNRLATCRTCHPKASASFASWDPHADKHSKERSPLYYYTARFMEILLAGVFAFFSIHTVFWFYRSLRTRLAGRSGKGAGDHSAEDDR